MLRIDLSKTKYGSINLRKCMFKSTLFCENIKVDIAMIDNFTCLDR